MKSKSDYLAEFKTQNEQKYTNTFKTEPATRPSYIPATNNGFPLVYNPTYSGYGYLDGTNRWVAYDALSVASDIAYRDALRQHQYSMAATPAVYTNNSHAPGFGLVVFFIVVVVGVLIFVVYKLNDH